MTAAQLIRQLGLSPVRGPDDVARAVASVDAMEPSEILAFVDFVARGGADAVQHHTRCQVAQRLIEERGDRRLFLPLIRGLRDPDLGIRSAIAAALPKVNDPSQHLELCALLSHGDRAVRQAAAQVLSKVGGKTVLAEIGELVREPAFPARILAVEVAVRIGGHHAIPVMAGALKVADSAEKQRIVRLLGEETFMARDRVGALNLLGVCLCDADPLVLSSATESFGRLATEEEWFDFAAPALDSPHLVVVGAAVNGLRRWASPRAVDALARKLRSGPKAVRLQVLGVLESIATEAVLPVVVEALVHRQIEVRTRAGDVLAALGRGGKVEVVRTILWLLRSGEPETRRMAVEIARKTKDPTTEIWPRLFELLRDEDWWVRERVSDALLEMGGDRLLPYVVGFLKDPLAPVRLFGVEVIRKLKAQKALAVLVKATREDPDWWVRERAVEAIGVMGDPRAAPYLVDLANKDPGLRISAIATLATLKATEMAGQVALFLASPDASVRHAALSCLESLGAADQSARVVPLVDDPDPAVATLARRLTVGWKIQVDLGSRVLTGHSPLDRLCQRAADMEVDDLLLVPGRVPIGKRFGKMEPLGETPLTAADVQALLAGVVSASQLADLEARQDVDVSYQLPGGNLRYRANLFHQRVGLSAVFRVIRSSIPSLDELDLPASVRALANLHNGLVLVGGPTGAGKSTTLAALIDRINATTSRHVVTLEDPIEVVHGRKRGLINQRELGTHALGYVPALRATMRQDPDVILIGEMRDHDTISFAVTAAETGHLVLGTVHTLAADTTVDRLIHAFPAEQQDQVRAQLAGSLRGVVCQFLLPRIDQNGRVLACEVMLNTDAVAHQIREGKTFQIPTVIATSREAGMQSMDAELLRLYTSGVISGETAYVKARNKKEFESLIGEEATDDLPTSTASIARRG